MKHLFGKFKHSPAGSSDDFIDELNAADIDFVTHSNAAILEQTPRGGRFILWAVLLCICFVIAWSSWAKLDEITRGEGKVIPSRQLQVMQNLEGGILSELLVREGEVVENPWQYY